MAKNENLHKAKDAKNDEFYTQLKDIESEISQHKDYVKQFEGKTVLCNCDDPEWSNFFLFFKLHFKQLKLKKLITTHYNKDGEPSYKLEWEGEMLNDDMVNLVKTPLMGNGDFRSDECIEILKEVDIIVTNPPFSLFREYVAQLIEYNKKFIIIGSQNAITYKEFFPLLKNNKVWIGYNNVKEFKQPDGTIKKFGNICWYTNLDIDKLHEPLILTKNYKGNEEKYPKYDNYDAIECSKVKDIPKDYVPCWFDCPCAKKCEYAKSKGMTDNALCEQKLIANIAVPITYMDKHNPEQFEIVNANDIRENESIKEKPHGLIKDKEASITTKRPYEEINTHTHTHTHTHEQPMQELSSDTRRCNGVIGVPVTFFGKFCPKQFEIIGHEHDIYGNGGEGIRDGEFKVSSIGKYKRILVRRK